MTKYSRLNKAETNTGSRVCLKCDKKFESEDVIRNRICPKCNRDNKNVFVVNVINTASGRLE